MLAALVLVAAATCADAGESYGASKFTVTGTVLCQDCTKNWNAYAYNAKPIAGTVRLNPLHLSLARTGHRSSPPATGTFVTLRVLTT